MKKIKLTKEEKKACRDVITFWKKIEKRLVNKEKIEDGWWVEGDVVVPNECPFCRVAKQKSEHDWCKHCVYHKTYGYECYDEDGGHLKKFERNPNLRTCRVCIRAVQRILDNAK